MGSKSKVIPTRYRNTPLIWAFIFDKCKAMWGGRGGKKRLNIGSESYCTHIKSQCSRNTNTDIPPMIFRHAEFHYY